MKKQIDKQAKRASKLAKAENLKIKQQEIAAKTVMVKNAEGDPDTTAEIVVQNQINYIPKVSVIIPVYNVEQYLRECLDSVVNQTLKEIEIICVDDGSTDKSLDILKEYAKKDKRITVLKQQNAGSGPARNNGILTARGEFVAFMDSDDMYPSEKTLEHMYQAARKNDALVCGGGANQLRDGILDTGDVKDCFTFNEDGFICYKDYQFDYGYWRFIYNRQFLRDNQLYFPNYLRYQDPPFFIKTMALAEKFYALKELTYTHRVSHNATKLTLKKAQDIVKGITDELILSQEYNLNQLHYQCSKQKLWNKWFIKNVYNLLDVNDPLLTKMLNAVNVELVKQIDPSYTLPTYEKIPVSVVIPVYNVEKYLHECLDSVVNQTLKNIEIICIDDCSPDNSSIILQEYAKKDNRIKIYKNSVNKGLGYSRNLGIRKAQGKYIFFLDSDDFIAAETLENLYNKIEQHQADLCQYLLFEYDNKTKNKRKISLIEFNKIRKLKSTYSYKDDFHLLFYRVEAPLKLYKRDFLINNSIKFLEGCYFEDTIVHIKCIALAKKICLEDNAYYYYRKNREGQITGKAANTDKFLDIFNYINEAETFFKEQGMWKEIKNYYYDFSIKRICSYYSQCNNDTKKKFVKKVKLWVKNKKLSDLEQSCPIKFAQFNYIVHSDNVLGKVCAYLLFPYYLIAIRLMQKKQEKLQGDIHKNKKSAFKHFLYHQIKTDSYTKTYVCGIRVRKKPANIYSYIDNRLAQIVSAQKQQLNALAQTVEMQEKAMADKIDMAFAEQQLLFEQITSLHNECNKKFECLSSWIENENISIKDIMQKISVQEKALSDFRAKNQANYQELNYADLLHDSIRDCNWLKNKSFSLFGWAANYSFIYILYRILDQVKPMNILEMGLGQTTKLTSQYIAYKNPQAELDVCEHNQDWIDIYSPDLPKAENIRINYFGLENFEYEGQENDKYSGLLPFVGKRRFDLIIVDGSIGEGRNLPRSNILDLIANGNLTDNFIIIFDDAGREGEKTTIAKTKELLQKQNIEYCSFERKGIKRQCIITGGVYSFAQYL